MRKIQRLGLAAPVVFAIASYSVGSASAASQPMPLTMQGWQTDIGQVPAVGSDCFHASFPALVWQAVGCVKAPDLQFSPAPPTSQKAAPDTVGAGTDYSAEVSSGLISKATGTFTNVSSKISEKGQIGHQGPEYANEFSLQLNSEFFTGTPACAGASDPSTCQGWEQFVYITSANEIYIQFWLLGYNAPCPSGWTSPSSTPGDCVTNSPATPLSGSALTAKSLATISLTGSAAPGGNDDVELITGGQATLAIGEDNTVYLGSYWNTTEWGVFGDGEGGEAYFGKNNTLEAVTTLTATSRAAPICERKGFTGETNNLKLAATPALGAVSSPTLASKQTDGAGGAKNCKTAAPPGWGIVGSSTAYAMGDSLSGVSCASANFCMAVGDSNTYTKTLIQEWNVTDGATWGIVSSPNVNNTDYDALSSVSCTSATFCMAVGASSTSGYPDFQSLTEEWNGTSWSSISSPNVNDGDFLKGVSCVSTSFCLSVGWSYTNTSNLYQTLIEAWNGTSWSIVNSPDPSVTYDALSGISCTSASSCIAVGEAVGPSGSTLIEKWNGSTWLTLNSPDTSNTDGDYLNGVSCASASFCTATGSWFNAYPGTNGGTLIEAWDGTNWKIVSSPTANDNTDVLTAVSCTSVSFCAAAGTTADSFSGPGPNLIEQWNGKTWAIVSSLSTGGPYDEDILNGVSCASASFCIAAGLNYAAYDAYSNGTLIEESS